MRKVTLISKEKSKIIKGGCKLQEDKFYIRVHYNEADCEDDIIECICKDSHKFCIGKTLNKVRSFALNAAREENGRLYSDYLERSCNLLDKLTNEFGETMEFGFVNTFLTVYINS